MELQHLQIFAPPTPAHATEFCVELDNRTLFTGSNVPPALTKDVCDTNTDARSVVGN